VDEEAGDARPSALVVDLLGDFNRTGCREIRLKALVALGEELGVPGPTMRVTLARLRERGWFTVRRDGRESVYRLASTAVGALEDGGRRIFGSGPQPWRGEWSMVIYTVPENDRQTRDELRKQLVWHGFGPLAPATWICPQHRLDDIAAAAANLPSARLTLLTTRTSGPAEDRELAGRCWDLEALAAGYEGFAGRIRARRPRYERAALDDRSALVERIRLVHDYRHLVRHDPQLPRELLPAEWPGEEARQLFHRAHALLATRAPNHSVHAVEDSSRGSGNPGCGEFDQPVDGAVVGR
jgi:phenylacetic acid degradation operon negative regulatory protein